MQQEMQNTEALITASQQGNRDAFERLVETHYDLMYRFAWKFSGNRADAEDITQLACIKLARGIGQFRFESRFTSWLYRLVINTGKDHLKSGRQSEDIDEKELATETDSGESIRLRQVLDLVGAMGDQFQETLVLVVGEGLSHETAAEVLGVKPSTVSWRIHEIRRRLAEGGY